MSPVDFKKWLCPLSILRNGYVPCRKLLNGPVEFKVVQCHLSNLRKGRVALSNLRVKGLISTWTCTDPPTTYLQHRAPRRRDV